MILVHQYFFQSHKKRLAIASQYFNDTPVNNLSLFPQAKIFRILILVSILIKKLSTVDKTFLLLLLPEPQAIHSESEATAFNLGLI